MNTGDDLLFVLVGGIALSILYFWSAIKRRVRRWTRSDLEIPRLPKAKLGSPTE